jgi:hypothetical protein
MKPETSTAETNAEVKTETDAAPVEDPRMTALEATVSSIQDMVKSFQTVIDGIKNVQEVQATEFARKLDAQKTEFTAQLKDADILAARKVAATGAGRKGKPSPSRAG